MKNVWVKKQLGNSSKPCQEYSTRSLFRFGDRAYLNEHGRAQRRKNDSFVGYVLVVDNTGHGVNATEILTAETKLLKQKYKAHSAQCTIDCAQ